MIEARSEAVKSNILALQNISFLIQKTALIVILDIQERKEMIETSQKDVTSHNYNTFMEYYFPF